MPRKKYFITAQSDKEQTIYLQKRLVLGNLNEVYKIFKEEYL